MAGCRHPQPRGFSFTPRTLRIAALALLLGGSLALVSCEEPTEYNEQVMNEFMVACRLRSSLEFCECRYELVSQYIRFAEMQEFMDTPPHRREEKHKVTRQKLYNISVLCERRLKRR